MWCVKYFQEFVADLAQEFNLNEEKTTELKELIKAEVKKAKEKIQKVQYNLAVFAFIYLLITCIYYFFLIAGILNPISCCYHRLKNSAKKNWTQFQLT
jgi:hypothetical protein